MSPRSRFADWMSESFERSRERRRLGQLHELQVGSAGIAARLARDADRVYDLIILAAEARNIEARGYSGFERHIDMACRQHPAVAQIDGGPIANVSDVVKDAIESAGRGIGRWTAGDDQGLRSIAE